VTNASPFRWRIQATWQEIASSAAFFAFIVLVIAELTRVDRSVISEVSGSGFFFLVALISALRPAYDHRHSGRRAVLTSAAKGILVVAATLVVLVVVVEAIRPFVRAQPWLPPVLVGIAVVGAFVVLVRNVVLESTAVGRAIAVGEDIAVLMIPFGLWVAMATWNEAQTWAGGAVMLAGPITLYWLQRERRRRGLVRDVTAGRSRGGPSRLQDDAPL